MGAITRFWQTIRPVRKVGKLRGIIEVPTFSVPSGKRSVLELTDDHCYFTISDSATVTSAFTVRCWVKLPNGVSNSGETVICTNDKSLAADTLRLSIKNGYVQLFITTSDVYAVTSAIRIRANVWTHIAAVYAGNRAWIYINGELDTDSLTYGYTLGVGNVQPPPHAFCIGSDASGGFTDRIYISDLELWQTDETVEALRDYMFRIAYGAGNSDILVQLTFKEGPGETTVKNYATGNSFSITAQGDPAPSLLEFYPHDHWFGASFIVGEYTIDTGGIPFSLKFPVIKPYDCVNFVPCISWHELDCDGNVSKVHRYQLWHVDGEELFPDVVDYCGQLIESGAKLEIWSIDDNLTADLTTAFDLETSILHIVDDPTSTTQTADATLGTVNTNIAEPFPLTPFPLDFDQQLVI